MTTKNTNPNIRTVSIKEREQSSSFWKQAMAFVEINKGGLVNFEDGV